MPTQRPPELRIAAVSKVLPEAPAAGPALRLVALAGLVRTARIRQWPKNILVFAAPGAAGRADPLGAAAADPWWPSPRSAPCRPGPTSSTTPSTPKRTATTRPSGYRPVAAGIVSRSLAIGVGAACMASASGPARRWPGAWVWCWRSTSASSSPTASTSSTSRSSTWRPSRPGSCCGRSPARWRCRSRSRSGFSSSPRSEACLMVTGQAAGGARRARCRAAGAHRADARRVQPDLPAHRAGHLGRRGHRRLLPLGVQPADRPGPPSRPHLVPAVDRADDHRPAALHVPGGGRQGAPGRRSWCSRTARCRCSALVWAVLFALGVYVS